MPIKGCNSYKDLVKSLIYSKHSVDVLVIKNPSLKGDSLISIIENYGGCRLYKQGEFLLNIIKV